MKNVARIILYAGLRVVPPLLCIRVAFYFSDNIFLKYYMIGAGVLAGILLVGRMFFNFSYNYYYYKKITAAIPLLKSDRTEEYIAALEPLQRRAKGCYAASLIAIHLSAGYIKLKQYSRAAEQLEQLTLKKCPAVLKLLHRINLCLCYFCQKQTGRAMALYESSLPIFEPYRNHNPYGGSIAVLDIYAAISAKDYARAADMLQAARKTWDDPKFLEDYDYLEKTIKQSPVHPIPGKPGTREQKI